MNQAIAESSRGNKNICRIHALLAIRWGTAFCHADISEPRLGVPKSVESIFIRERRHNAARSSHQARTINPLFEPRQDLRKI